jgi:5-dehydro-4-deoxyglucarate dehydratase
LTWIGGVGDDSAPGYAAIGLEVLTSSISALAPRLSLAWGEAALDRDFPRLNELLAKYVHPLFALRGRKRGYEVAAMKKASELLGRPVGPARPPLPELGDAEITELRQIVDSWQPFL